MIEREAQVKIYSEVLGAKGARGKLIRVAAEGFYEISLEVSGRMHTTLLPISSTVVVAADPEEQVATLEVER